MNGTGLGLYHAQKNLQAWQGTIECLPAASGVGTQFVVSLPLAQTGIVYRAKPSDTQLWVIDDDPAVAEALARNGYAVLESARSFTTGKSLLTKDRPPGIAVLVDQDLGSGQLGTDLIAEMRGRQDVFLCTNDFDDPEVVRRAKAVGVGIIPKPLVLLARGGGAGAKFGQEPELSGSLHALAGAGTED